MRITRSQLRRIIKESVSEKKRLDEVAPLAALIGGGVLIALTTKGGRSLLAKVLRIPGNLLDELETIDDRLAASMGKKFPVIDEISKLATEMMPGRLAADQMAELLEGMTDEEADGLNKALEPVKVATPAGRIAKAAEVAG